MRGAPARPPRAFFSFSLAALSRGTEERCDDSVSGLPVGPWRGEAVRHVTRPPRSGPLAPWPPWLARGVARTRLRVPFLSCRPPAFFFRKGQADRREAGRKPLVARGRRVGGTFSRTLGRVLPGAGPVPPLPSRKGGGEPLLAVGGWRHPPRSSAAASDPIRRWAGRPLSPLSQEAWPWGPCRRWRGAAADRCGFSGGVGEGPRRAGSPSEASLSRGSHGGGGPVLGQGGLLSNSLPVAGEVSPLPLALGGRASLPSRAV